ncbi:hypothetical protein [Streptomyces sp. NBC_01237]|uniref:hypothetical protein n=1 Tax=Streptomyces sp. NBC_01237 TaxID=2903790 RepID=UPI002DDBDA01|nr:hypothetical protein [Streptomyces sp. NBC_01237]WRZ77178.1 hypothetical protein OG251_36540 [Streptomyces sp. NBC_01237]WRZ78482.1 hypothetical protein OG251_43410 [Streptomyces sp. NBC_01237]
MRKTVVSIAGGMMLLTGLMATPAMASAPSTVARLAPMGAQDCTHFDLVSNEGAADGWICGNSASGWVEDRRADGRCPFVRFWDSATGKEVNGPSVGPKGRRISFGVNTPSGYAFYGYAAMEWRSC